MGSNLLMIGSIIAAVCQDNLGRLPNITIDNPTRLALAIEATPAEWDTVMAALPLEIPAHWESLSISTQGEVLSVQMKKRKLPKFTRITGNTATKINSIESFLENLA